METDDKESNYDWFEDLYANSGNDTSKIPWSDLQGNSYLQEWIERQDMTSYRNKSVLIVGCGIGGDAELLSHYFGKVSAFDVSPSAIKWVKEKYYNSKINYYTADLFDKKALFHTEGPYDFIFEAYTIQALPQNLQFSAMKIISKLVAKGGELLVICDGRKNNEEGFTMPHPLSKDDLATFEKQLTMASFEELEGHRRRGFSKRTFRVLYNML